MALIVGGACLALLAPSPESAIAAASSEHESIEDALQAAGYTDLAVLESSDSLTVQFTNQRWWRPSRAFGEILQLLTHHRPAVAKYRIVPQENRVPLGTLEVDGPTYRRWQANMESAADVVRTLTWKPGHTVPTKRGRSSLGWVDLGIAPTYSLASGLTLGVAESWHVTCMDGLTLSAETQQAITGPGFRPVEKAHVTSIGWLGDAWFYHARAGFNGRPGWGGQLDLIRPQGALDWRIQGCVNLEGQSVATAGCAWATGWRSTILKAEGGRYLDGDLGLRLSIIQNHDRSQLELNAIVTTTGLDLRTILTVDLAGAKRPEPSALRIMGGELFVPYQADRATRARKLDYVDVFDRLFLDLTEPGLAASVETWPR